MIKIINLWKKYGQNEVLRGVNLTINKGEILVILGKSGVGKSVLLKHIMGLEAPDRGEVQIEGVEIFGLEKPELYQVQKSMGMLFQGAALFDSMDIGTNTAFYLDNHKNPKTKKHFLEKEIKMRVKKALEMVGLKNVEHKMPSELSGGMKKRAALARLIVYRPSILLYDEPTTGLDPQTAQQINELILATQKELKGTSIIVTHDIHSALYLADRIALCDKGKIQHIAVPKEFLKINHPMINFLKQNLCLQGDKTCRQR
jgi:phospholipid/cholesterol/gamma-HCH transport system ATP-binding protein